MDIDEKCKKLNCIVLLYEINDIWSVVRKKKVFKIDRLIIHFDCYIIIFLCVKSIK